MYKWIENESVDSNLIVGKKFYSAAEPAQILSYKSLPVKNLLSVAILLYMIRATTPHSGG